MANFRDFIEHRREQRRERQHVREILSEDNNNFW
jgi:hypothetical protein